MGRSSKATAEGRLLPHLIRLLSLSTSGINLSGSVRDAAALGALRDIAQNMSGWVERNRDTVLQVAFKELSSALARVVEGPLLKFLETRTVHIHIDVAPRGVKSSPDKAKPRSRQRSGKK